MRTSVPIPVPYSDIPGGKELHDCSHLPDCPYLFTGPGWMEVTSGFMHTRWRDLSLSLPLRSFPLPTPPSLRAGISVAISQIWSSSLIRLKRLRGSALVLFDVQSQSKMSPASSGSASAGFPPSSLQRRTFPPCFQELSCGDAHVPLQNRKLFGRGVKRDRGGSFPCEVILSHGERDMTAAHGGMFGVSH